MTHTLHSRESGQGPDVLLLHGLFGQSANLRSVARALEPEFRVHGLDLPDHGQSLWLSDTSLPAYATCVSDWMADQGIDHAHVIGHSLGGKVAMELALTTPAKVGRLVVADIQGAIKPLLPRCRRCNRVGVGVAPMRRPSCRIQLRTLVSLATC